MSQRFFISTQKRTQAGFSLIELMIAGAVLTFGFLALIILVTTAMANNGRSQRDTTSVMLAQSIVEQINATLAGAGTSSITDCAGNTWNINTGIGGAALSGTSIDYGETSPPANYYMNYVVCNGTQQTTYDIRWRVEALAAGGYTSETYLVTIGTKLKGAADKLQFFALPINMRVLVGQ